uniref:Secreted protein n=1 Tax=Anopheles quadriannulatus TaxID=34691 RepID=A0A182XSZ0_ANOQN
MSVVLILGVRCICRCCAVNYPTNTAAGAAAMGPAIKKQRGWEKLHSEPISKTCALQTTCSWS